MAAIRRRIREGRARSRDVRSRDEEEELSSSRLQRRRRKRRSISVPSFDDRLNEGPAASESNSSHANTHRSHILAICIYCDLFSSKILYHDDMIKAVFMWSRLYSASGFILTG